MPRTCLLLIIICILFSFFSEKFWNFLQTIRRIFWALVSKAFWFFLLTASFNISLQPLFPQNVCRSGSLHVVSQLGSGFKYFPVHFWGCATTLFNVFFCDNRNPLDLKHKYGVLMWNLQEIPALRCHVPMLDWSLIFQHLSILIDRWDRH